MMLPSGMCQNRHRLNQLLVKIITQFLTIFALCFTTLSYAAPPKGWWAAQSDEYQIGVDKSDPEKPAAFIEAIVPAPEQFIALNQTISANDYRDKRVRRRGMIKTKDVASWAGFWLRADDGKNKVVAFDNMQRRGLSGTSDWTTAEIVLDIPSEAEKLSLGLILDRKGKVWMRGLTFEVVDDSVPVTAPKMTDLPSTPANLDFKE